MATPTQESEKRTVSRNAVLIGIIIILLGVNVIQYFMGRYNESKNKAILEEALENNQSLQREKQKLLARMDSVETELKAKIAQVAKLGGDVQLLQQALQRLETNRNALLASNKLLKEQLEKYDGDNDFFLTVIATKDAEIADLKKQNQIFYSDNIRLTDEKVALDSTISEMKFINEDLKKLVSKAAVLRAENIKVYAIAGNGKERLDVRYKQRYAEKLRLSFVLGQNDIATVETKVAYVRVIEPSGQVMLSEAFGGGNMQMATGEYMPYTAKQSFMFDNKQPSLSYTISKGSDFVTGKYKFEIYCEGHLIGSHSIEILK